MKLLLTTLSCLACFAGYAQSYTIQPPAKSSDLLSRLRSRAEIKSPVPLDTLMHPLNDRIALKKLPGIYSLPQDNMPCLVPDTKSIVAIPNAWKGSVRVPFKSRIPNPAVPETGFQRGNRIFVQPETSPPDTR